MAFCEDLFLLQLTFNKVSAVPWDPVTPLPLRLQCLYSSVLDLLQKYRYTARDASAAFVSSLKSCKHEDYADYFTRKSTVDRILYDFDNHGVTAIMFNIGELMRVLHGLDVQYETRMKRLALEACISLPMIYDGTFRYRSTILYSGGTLPFITYDKKMRKSDIPLSPYHSKFRSPINDPLTKTFTLRYNGDLDMYKHFRSGWLMNFGTDGLVRTWFQPESHSALLSSLHNPFMFFGPTTRTTQITCFTFSNGINIQFVDNQFVVQRQDKSLSFTASTRYLPITGELQYTESSTDTIDLKLVCETSSADPNRVRVSLVTRVTLLYTRYGVQVTKIKWIDAEHLRNDEIRYSFSKGGPLEYAAFPHDVIRLYKTWRVVMGNSCRLKVRMSRLWIVSDHRDTRPHVGDQSLVWSVTNTDNHRQFAECASMLQRYYAFQGRGGTVHPLECTSVAAFVHENEKRVENLNWLVEARLERPSTTGTPPTRFADHRTSRLLHAAVIKELTMNWCFSAEYSRLSNVSST